MFDDSMHQCRPHLVRSSHDNQLVGIRQPFLATSTCTSFTSTFACLHQLCRETCDILSNLATGHVELTISESSTFQ
jgi:hypothetical protein